MMRRGSALGRARMAGLADLPPHPLRSSSACVYMGHINQIFTTILGSDLPPRHSPNQTLTNLAFLLRTEDLSLPFSHSLPFYLPPTLKIQRRFLLNRMVPGVDRDRVIALLEGAGKVWDEVAWDDDGWRGTGFRWDGLGEGGGRWGFGGNKTTGEGDEGADLGREGWKELDWAMADQNRVRPTLARQPSLRSTGADFARSI